MDKLVQWKQRYAVCSPPKDHLFEYIINRNLTLGFKLHNHAFRVGLIHIEIISQNNFYFLTCALSTARVLGCTFTCSLYSTSFTGFICLFWVAFWCFEEELLKAKITTLFLYPTIVHQSLKNDRTLFRRSSLPDSIDT